MVEQHFAHDAVPLDQIDQVDDVQVSLQLFQPLVQVKVIPRTLDPPQASLRSADEAPQARFERAQRRVPEHGLVDNQVVNVIQLLALRPR